MLRRAEKLLTEIIGPKGIKKKKCKIDGKKLIIKSGIGRSQAWKPTFNRNCILKHKGFLRTTEKVMVFEDAPKCIEFVEKKTKQPTFDKKTSEKLFEAEVLRKAGMVTTKMQVPIFVYLLLGALLILGVMQFLFSTGKIRFA